MCVLLSLFTVVFAAWLISAIRRWNVDTRFYRHCRRMGTNGAQWTFGDRIWRAVSEFPYQVRDLLLGQKF